ncbi:DUF1694 domain-containing protein [Loigolactobacillus backii]|uniref:Uncharacterized protein n=1 Tax=Loigolactobacillus backii TaxID=375175 RepID=A0A192GYT9_9LACO|nr:DUF1694 domain-containing protein [Loigolactobacillus backii]ANK60737.1 hypothetical protein AYR52_11035 [Loigolactobacillus backii]ANK61694.1 hypothetical protein AYR53_02290 [Loigolactobacillus backii]ANK65690.1 hypothetical protein AYR54_10835 [Loigolactobacillus backii]ANK68167.1 hypothetical protein AYR55_10990 [Loigolactobacillus backii]ANK69109.1 hypothetical protein AYR56_02425 [Loigolactobacillus backii]
MANEMQEYLRTHLFGTPQLKPDEKRAFLGNFRERVAMAVTVGQLRTPKAESVIKTVLTRYPQYRIYLNGRMGKTLINRYMRLAVALDYPFTILAQMGVRVQRDVTDRDFGLVIASPDGKIKRPVVL